MRPPCGSIFASPSAAMRPPQAVVGGDEADVVAALQSRVDDDDWNLRARRVAHRPHQRRFVERRQHDARHTARDEAFDLGDLRRAIVFAKRASPDDVDAKLLRRLRRACVNALPEHVRRALRNDGDCHLAAVGWRRRAARAESRMAAALQRTVPISVTRALLRCCATLRPRISAGATGAPRFHPSRRRAPRRACLPCNRRRARWCGRNRRPPCTPASQNRRASRCAPKQSNATSRYGPDVVTASSASSPLRSRAPTACRTPAEMSRARGSLLPIPASRLRECPASPDGRARNAAA